MTLPWNLIDKMYCLDLIEAAFLWLEIKQGYFILGNDVQKALK